MFLFKHRGHIGTKEFWISAFEKMTLWVNGVGDFNRHQVYLPLSLTVRNQGSRAFVLEWRTAQIFEIVLEDARGNVVTRYSTSYSFAPYYVTNTINAGQSLTYNGSLKLPENLVAPGSYVAKMYLTADKKYGGQVAIDIAYGQR